MPVLKPKSSPAKTAPSPHFGQNGNISARDTGGGIAAQLQAVSMRYGRGEEVLRDVHLTLPAGGLTFLTGPSGAGKSSLLRLLYLAARPSRGLISIFGQDLSGLSPHPRAKLRSRIGVVLQDFSLIDSLSVFENVALPLRVAGVPRKIYAPNVLELLDWVGLGHRLDAQPATLSGGEKQRAAIARAVIAKPDMLIADEPTGNVDAAMGARLIRLLSEMNRMGTTVIIATHDTHLIDPNARVITLKGGRLISAKADAPSDSGASS